MSRNKFWTVISKALAVITVTLVAILWLAPGAWAASSYTVLYQFSGADGYGPSGVVFDGAGNLYGTTYSGGAYGWGSVFELTPNPDGTWAETVLYSFQNNMEDGRNPNAALILDTAGNLYGTIECVACRENDQGGAFKLTHNPDGSWTESIVATFGMYWTGASPHGMIFDAAGNLYGTTSWGVETAGGVYELTPESCDCWEASMLLQFNWSNGGAPVSTVVLDASGNVYGTSSNWGRRGKGNVFKLTREPDGSWKMNAIHSFSGGTDGGTSTASLIFDSSGNLYGTASAGGAFGHGIVFQLTPGPLGGWKERVLHSFTGGKDGASPAAGLVFDAAGNLYGTASAGGRYGCGVVFKLTHGRLGGWNEQVLRSFEGHSGQNPSSVLVRDAAGNLYGTIQGDGQKTFGAVFEITP